MHRPTLTQTSEKSRMDKRLSVRLRMEILRLIKLISSLDAFLLSTVV